jgi:hypothetical protein
VTDTASATEWRWARADEQARVVLAAERPRRFPVLAVAALVAVVLVVVLGVALATPPDSAPRWTVAVVGAVLGLAMVGVDVARTVRGRRRRPELLPVISSLTGREQRAVGRAVHGRVVAPADRLRVVRAAAVQTASGQGVLVALGLLLVIGSVAGTGAGGTGSWFVVAAAAVVQLVSAVVALRAVAAARRFLGPEPVDARRSSLSDRNPGTRSGRSDGS